MIDKRAVAHILRPLSDPLSSSYNGRARRALRPWMAQTPRTNSKSPAGTSWLSSCWPAPPLE